MPPGGHAIAPEIVDQAATGIVPASGGWLDRWRGRLRSAWFGPGEPIPVVVGEIEPRAFDYPSLWNSRTQPRGWEPVGFAALRALADNCDLVRMAIETRKAQIAKLRWRLVGEDGEEEPAGVEPIRRLMRRPDRHLRWRFWLKALLEDLLVCDAAAIYVRRTRGGAPLALELLDAATIKPILDVTGRPMLEGPAFQQVVKGMPAVEFTRDELLYVNLNPRTNKVFGSSPVEWILVTVNLAIRRQISQLQFYTDGTVPEAVVAMPERWSAPQVKEFQLYWDSLFENNQAQKRRMRFVPGGQGFQIHWPKEAILKDEMDEWLARVVAYAFSLPPTWAVRQMNRATAEVVQDAALNEGMYPFMEDAADVLNEVYEVAFRRPDVLHAWDDPRQPDALKKAQTDAIYLGRAVLTINEVRKRSLELPPLPDGDVAMIDGAPIPLEEAVLPPEEPPPGDLPPGAPPAPGGNADDAGADDDDDEEGDEEPTGPRKIATPGLRKRRRTVRDLTRAERRLSAAAARSALPVRRAQQRLRRRLARVLTTMRADVTRQLTAALAKTMITGPLRKEAAETRAARIAAELNLDGFSVLLDPTAEQLEAAATAAAERAVLAVRAAAPSRTDDLALPAKAVTDFARARAAELVGKRIVAGEVIDNPNPAYAITEGTRELLRGTITQALEAEWSKAQLAEALRDAYAFSPARADMIAQTEISRALVEGTTATWQASGVVDGKESLLGSEHDDDDECDQAAADGVIPLSQAFSNGYHAPPYHPRCVCSVIAAVRAEEA